MLLKASSAFRCWSQPEGCWAASEISTDLVLHKKTRADLSKNALVYNTSPQQAGMGKGDRRALISGGGCHPWQVQPSRPTPPQRALGGAAGAAMSCRAGLGRGAGDGPRPADRHRKHRGVARCARPQPSVSYFGQDGTWIPGQGHREIRWFKSYASGPSPRKSCCWLTAVSCSLWNEREVHSVWWK